MIAAVAVLLAVNLIATSHHRPRPSQPPGQSDIILLGKKYCPMVNAARAAGLTDDQIIAIAVAKGVSPEMIIWAKKNCIVANGPRSSLQEVIL